MEKPFRITGIFEGAYHNEVLESYVHHVLPLTDLVYIFTTEFQWEQAKKWRENPCILWFVKPDTQKFENFFDSEKHHLTKCDWFIVTSLPEPLFPKGLLPSHAWLVIHNTRYHFPKVTGPYFLGKNRFRDMMKIIRYIMGLRWLTSKKVVNQFSNIIFPTDVMRARYLSHHLHPKFKHPVVIPFARWTPDWQRKPSEIFTIVVPGSISMDIRNYSLFPELVNRIKQYSPLPFHLAFLGSLKDQTCNHVIRDLENLQNDRFTFEYGRSFINQEEFEEKMSKAHVMICPLQEKGRYDAVQESFGYTTESGNIADIIKYQIPAYIPKFYPLPEPLQNWVSRFDSVELLAKELMEMIRDSEVGKNQPSFTSFSSEEVAKRIFNEWTKIQSKSNSFAHGR